MSSTGILRLRLDGPPEAIGAAHGAARAAGIRRYTADRTSLVCGGTWSGGEMSRERVLELAESMIPAHQAYSEELTAELAAMAAAAGISTAEAIVVGGFTDFVDTVRGVIGEAPYEDNCTAVIVPASVAESGQALLGQTWDMHDTAARHVVMLDVTPDRGPRSLVFSTEGCLGQIGMNEAGIAVGINNLTAHAGTIGVTWPHVVRRALSQTSLDAAVECVLSADLAGAHNYLIVDAAGQGANIEAMPQALAVTAVDAAAFVHTNHTLAAATGDHEAWRPSALMESSHRRLRRGRELVAGKTLSPQSLMELSRDPDAICQISHEPFHIESCGAAVMRPGTGEFWAVWGRPDLNEYEKFELVADPDGVAWAS
jgi:isopenicillin-N N-acyltransferase-like protein